jgi:endonuclease III
VTRAAAAKPVAKKKPAPRLNVARETAAAKRARAGAIARGLAKTYPDADCELDYKSPWQLLVATILSAQCTDKMVNQVTPSLFAAYPTPADLAAAPAPAVETLIKRTGFFRQKTKSIQGVARAVAQAHGGQVPPDMDVLTTLPGVGRKTANVILGTAFGKPAIFVDTHVRRLSNRLGLTVSDDPVVIEQDLQKLLAPRVWTATAHRLIHHGRRVCFARKPRCSGCALLRWCPQIGVADAV